MPPPPRVWFVGNFLNFSFSFSFEAIYQKHFLTKRCSLPDKLCIGQPRCESVAFHSLSLVNVLEKYFQALLMSWDYFMMLYISFIIIDHFIHLLNNRIIQSIPFRDFSLSLSPFKLLTNWFDRKNLRRHGYIYNNKCCIIR